MILQQEICLPIYNAYRKHAIKKSKTSRRKVASSPIQKKSHKLCIHRCAKQRPVMNLTPRGEKLPPGVRLCLAIDLITGAQFLKLSQGAKFNPRDKVVPQGWTLSPRGEVIPRRNLTPGIKLAPRVELCPPGVKLSPRDEEPQFTPLFF
jgi:hypothetical protein